MTTAVQQHDHVKQRQHNAPFTSVPAEVPEERQKIQQPLPCKGPLCQDTYTHTQAQRQSDYMNKRLFLSPLLFPLPENRSCFHRRHICGYDFKPLRAIAVATLTRTPAQELQQPPLTFVTPDPHPRTLSHSPSPSSSRCLLFTGCGCGRSLRGGWFSLRGLACTVSPLPRRPFGCPCPCFSWPFANAGWTTWACRSNTAGRGWPNSKATSISNPDYSRKPKRGQNSGATTAVLTELRVDSWADRILWDL